MTLADRQTRVVALALACGTLLGVMGVLHAPTQLVGVASVIASVLAPVGAMYGWTASAEWRARAADSSSIPEQEHAAAAPAAPSPGATP